MPGVITSEDLKPFERVLVFVSHSHEDHFDPSIYEWQDEGRVTYLLGDDIPQRWPGERLSPGDERRFGQVLVRACDSTDLGVSFLVKLPEYTLFHAGDLNLWHWRDASSVREIAQAEDAFYAAMKPIEQEKIDVAFFPVDPRQGSLYDAGALYFLMSVKPRLMIPIHFQDRGDVAMDFARKNRSRKSDIVALTRRGESIFFGQEPEREADAGEDVPAAEPVVFDIAAAVRSTPETAEVEGAGLKDEEEAEKE
jgi:L-ascorbate metabolism protein UlaG (beta-lactamase superfamily)